MRIVGDPLLWIWRHARGSRRIDASSEYERALYNPTRIAYKVIKGRFDRPAQERTLRKFPPVQPDLFCEVSHANSRSAAQHIAPRPADQLIPSAPRAVRRVYAASRCVIASLTAVHRDTWAEDGLPVQVRLHERQPVADGCNFRREAARVTKRYFLAICGARVKP